DCPERNALVARDRERYPNSPMDPFRLTFGTPSILICGDDGIAKYETEAAYLARLGLLLPGEAEAIAACSAIVNARS
ncbi:MAG: hypothetical protein Q8K78_10535, partial [Planctomycetaceae bacterium]|nr:hypothetical protein [Planctomycetaceae bacterium]